MRDKLIEMCLDFVDNDQGEHSFGLSGPGPYPAEELHRFTNEYLLKLIEEFLDKNFTRLSAIKYAKKNQDYDYYEKPEMGWLNITAIDNTYSEDVGGAPSDDVLFGGSAIGSLSHHDYSDWDGGDASKITGMPAFDFNPYEASKPKEEDTDNISSSLYNYNIGSD